MNAAFVILASALLGNPPAAAPCNTCSTPAPAASCSTCASHSHSFSFKLRGQFSGLLAGHGCHTACAAPCPAPAPVVVATPCATPCTTCGHGHTWGSGQLLSKLRGSFHSSHSCNACAPATCDGGCSSATAAPAVSVPAAAPLPATGETGAPKKMPDAPAPAPAPAPKADAPKGDKAVQFQETPEAPLAIPTPVVNPVSNARPNVIVAPATLRNPF